MNANGKRIKLLVLIRVYSRLNISFFLFPHFSLLTLQMSKVLLFLIRLLALLKARAAFSSIKEDIVESYRDGAVSYITKPMRFEDFVKVIGQFEIYWRLSSKIPGVK